jgi:type IV pilus assembly protein PilY1
MLKQMKLKMLAAGMALVLPTAGWSEVNFAQKPLAAGGGVDPNLMFMLDDSGSMRWGFMPDELMGGRNLGNCVSYVDYGGDGFCAMNIGDRSQLLSPTYNKLYYNPDVTYEPPLKADGTSYPDSDFYNARINGFDDSSAQVNLNTSYRAIMDDYYYYGWWNGNAIYGFTVSPYANATQAFYLDWTEGCGDPDSLSCYTQVSITDDAGRQNFANWYSYYRSREMAAKSGIGTVFANQDLSMDFRLGWGLINQGRNTVDDASSIRGVQQGVRPFEDVRADFLSWLYNGNASGSTPLQRALEGAGQYYENSRRAWLDDPAGSDVTSNPARECRIAATMLMTDGYYNTGDSYDPDLTENADNSDGNEITNGTGDSGKYVAEQPFSDTVTSRVTLADIAAYYWKRDLREDIDNYVPTVEAVEDTNNEGIRETIGNPAFWQHMMTYGIGFGVEGTVSRDDAVSAVLDGTSISWWDGNADEDKINDLLHASMNGRGDFFSAGDPSTFQSELEGLLDQFLGTAGSATGLDFNAASIDAVDAALSFSSFFEPNGWSGELEAISLEAGENGHSKWPPRRMKAGLQARNSRVLIRMPAWSLLMMVTRGCRSAGVT